MRYFGTDGVRATINSGSMTAENLVRLALAAGLYFMRAQSAKSHPRPLVVIGKDTRLSGYMVGGGVAGGVCFYRHGYTAFRTATNAGSRAFNP